MSSLDALPFPFDLQSRKLSGRTPLQITSPEANLFISTPSLSKVPGTSTLRLPRRKPKKLLLKNAGVRKRTAIRSSTSAPQEKSNRTENEMSPRNSRSDCSASPKMSSKSASSPKSKTIPKELDWTEISDPEERRRMQNRIAQRKFRSKAKENRERTEREAQNQEHAGNSYRIPSADEFSHLNDAEPSGLPWGSVNVGFIAARGYEYDSRRSSGRDAYVGDESYYDRYHDRYRDGYNDNYHYPYQASTYAGGSGSGSGGSVIYSQTGVAQTSSYGSPETAFYDSPRQTSYTSVPDQQQYWGSQRW